MGTNNLKNTIINRYSERTEQSKLNHAEAKAFLPGGDTRASTYFSPYPAYITKGEGCYIFDCDGNRYIDFLNNYTSLIHGHAHPSITKAICKQASLGTAYAAPIKEQTQLAEIICERVPGMDKIRFCNSGTEATMIAVQLARAVTGRDLIIKMEGGYHGSYDCVRVGDSTNIDGGPLTVSPVTLRGIPALFSDSVLLSRFNDLDTTRRILEMKYMDVAAIIVEPFVHSGGMIPAQDNYLNGLRSLADKFNVLLIFDEVACFRLAKGGVQSIYNVKPDITALGKIIGGGLPVGAVGGSDECMKHFDPSGKAPVKHVGTFNGNSLVMAAGIAALQLYDQEAIDHINGLGSVLRENIKNAFDSEGIRGQASGMGSMVQIHWTDEPLVSPWEVSIAKSKALMLPTLLHLEFMNRGISIGARGNCCLSTPMTETEIQKFTDEFKQILVELKPYMKDNTPHLLID